MSGQNVAALVLAAGTSSRLGQPKQLLPVDGAPLLWRTLDVVRASSISSGYVVLGGAEQDIRDQVRLDGFTVVSNPDYQSGQASSLRAGVAALPDTVEGVIVLLGDQPLVEPWLLDKLAAAFMPGTHVAVRPRYSDGPGNPILLSRELFADIMTLEGDTGARDILKKHRDRILDVDHSMRNSARDVDTLEDYQAFLLDWSSLGAPDVPRYCQRCSAEVRHVERHARLRPVCPVCNFTYFYDPKITVAVVIEIDGKIVMHKRAGDPGKGKWTFPSGFVDRGEVVHEAAIREVEEEVGLHIGDARLFNVYSRAGDTVVLIVFQATAHGQTPKALDETDEVRLCDPDDLPELAFPRDEQIVADWRASRDA